ncbi:MAG: MCP four helix bundle domain-containing protein [Desulfohalobiaceae bacterium]|nr:MCP four helix bundle domain-containing protein [Desulfohalobiaceae bacterium]
MRLPRFSLRTKITSLVLVMGLISMSGGSILYWYTLRMDEMLSVLIDKELILYKTAEDMELALANQKGYLTYYFVDHDPEWLNELGSQRLLFKQKLDLAHSQIQTPEQQALLDRITERYETYIEDKDKVVETYQGRDRESISRLHQKQREYFFNILNDCEAYKRLQLERIHAAQEDSRRQARKLRLAAASAIAGFFLVTLVLLVVLFKQILEPIREMAQEAGGNHRPDTKNEVQELSQSLQEFKADYDSAHLELNRSREHLEQAGKMALVGKLAAGVAHNIRSPFTSIKMRLFSLSRNLKLTPVQEEDFEVISSEISRIDNIVQNFLEFSRPPKLRMKACSLEQIVRSVIQLLQHRLIGSDVEVHYSPPPDFPQITADPERFKEALINLVVNACEAMPEGGRIEIGQEMVQNGANRVVAVKIADNGPGIPKEVQGKILEPFFSTKEEGTGLGLSLVKRIVEEHKGRLGFYSKEGTGTSFEIHIPWKEAYDGGEDNSAH